MLALWALRACDSRRGMAYSSMDWDRESPPSLMEAMLTLEMCEAEPVTETASVP
jgi:hypothetical protein